MKAIVLDYCWAKVYSVHVPDEAEESDKIEDYLEEEYGFHLKNCEWIAISDENVPVYDGNDEIVAHI